MAKDHRQHGAAMNSAKPAFYVAVGLCFCMACERAPHVKRHFHDRQQSARTLAAGAAHKETPASAASGAVAAIECADSHEVQRLLQTDIVQIQMMSAENVSNLVREAISSLPSREQLRLAQLLCAARRYAPAIDMLEHTVNVSEEPSELVVIHQELGQAYRNLILQETAATEAPVAESTLYRAAIKAHYRVVENPDLYLNPTRSTSDSELAYDLAFDRLKDLYLAVELDADKVMALCDTYEQQIERLLLTDRVQRAAAIRAHLYCAIGQHMASTFAEKRKLLISDSNVKKLEEFANTPAAVVYSPLETRLGFPVTTSVRDAILRGLTANQRRK